MPKSYTSISLSEVCLQLLPALMDRLGLSRADVIELAVRDLAERYKVSPKAGAKARIRSKQKRAGVGA